MATEEKKSSMTSMMVENRVFPPTAWAKDKAFIQGLDTYKEMYKRSVEDPDGFWGELAEKELDWFKKWDKVSDCDLTVPRIEYFIGGKLNVSYNCLDRHVKTWRKNKAAIIWEGNSPDQCKTYTYQQLLREVCKFANVLKDLGIKKGDRVSIYLPMTPELVIAMLACTRIGAVHSIVFAGFSAEALRDRILDCEAKILVTCDGNFRGAKAVPLKGSADIAVSQCPSIEKVIVRKHANVEVDYTEGRDLDWDELMATASPVCEPEVMDAEDPLFILYTSGSTGKPKGVLHTTAGYLLFALLTVKWIHDVHDDDTFWCTADIGWVTGHTYVTYGPLALGATSIVFEGVPNYPAPDRFWDVIEKHQVTNFYTAPTAIRACMRDGDEWPKKHDLSCLRILASVGEPINPEAWMWYYNVIGGGRCGIMDTWWQTETGGNLLTPLAGVHDLKPGSAVNPFFGIVPKIFRMDGTECDVNEGGFLCISEPWPGIMRGLWGDQAKFKEMYFSQFPGTYCSGDGARVDEDGYYWLMGRIDDVINVSGHRIGTAEVESALVAHEKVAEAAVVGMPHEIKGQGIYAYVTVNAGVEVNEELKKELITHVRKEIGPIASPDKLHFTDGLPKTRSGKIMRRILRKIAEGAIDELGDTSTLADPSVVDSLIAGRQ